MCRIMYSWIGRTNILPNFRKSCSFYQISNKNRRLFLAEHCIHFLRCTWNRLILLCCGFIKALVYKYYMKALRSEGIWQGRLHTFFMGFVSTFRVLGGRRTNHIRQFVPFTLYSTYMHTSRKWLKRQSFEIYLPTILWGLSGSRKYVSIYAMWHISRAAVILLQPTVLRKWMCFVTAQNSAFSNLVYSSLKVKAITACYYSFKHPGPREEGDLANQKTVNEACVQSLFLAHWRRVWRGFHCLPWKKGYSANCVGKQRPGSKISIWEWNSELLLVLDYMHVPSPDGGMDKFETRAKCHLSMPA